MKLVRYDIPTGKIKSVYFTDREENITSIYKTPPEPDVAVLSVDDAVFVDIATVYVSNGAVVPRPLYTAQVSSPTVPADGVTEFSVTGVPVASNVSLHGPVTDSWAADAGSISLTVNIAGSYMIRIDAFPYQDQRVFFDAT